MQVEIQELARLRDELTRLNDDKRAQRANANSASTRSYICIPRECQIQAFSGECGTDGRSVDEFIEEVKRALRLLPIKVNTYLKHVFL